MIKRHIFCLLAMFIAGMVSAQTLSQAKKLFDNEEYEKAKTAFAKFVKSAPSNAEYNFYYGASCYETGDKEKALPHLEKSANRKYINAYRYLGKLYADLYRFDEAVENYETHIEWLNEKNRDTALAEEELSEIRKKSRMFKSVEKVVVIDSVLVDKKSFLDAYRISKSSGNIYLNENGDGTVYENEMGNKRLITETTDSLSQLYTQMRLLDGWDKQEPVESLNEMGNVNYPFLMGDGITLYFACDGEGTLGGYDIFVTRYDSEDNTYLKPSNIGMPFNSTANDYMYAIDELNNLGWFATDRSQPADTVCIYVFVPNESKEMYNYETTDPQVIMNAATLHSISATWTDEEKVRSARQRLSALKYDKDEEEEQKDFTFIIDDTATYTKLDDFQSKEAQNAYRQLMQKEKDLDHLKRTLIQKRNEYEHENGMGRKKLSPSILDLEKRIPQLQSELDALTIQVRNLEIKQIRQ